MKSLSLAALAIAWTTSHTALAQSSPDLKDIFKNNDLVCISVLPNGNLECQLRPKVVAVSVVAVPAPSPVSSTASSPAKLKIAAVAAQPAAAAKPSQTFVEALNEIGQVDLSVPDSPALAVLGISPSQIQRPGTVRELASSVVKSFDSNGKPKSGVAIDFSPLPLFAPGVIHGGQQYASNYLVQAFTRTTVSVATTDADSSGSTQLAWGVRMGVFDFGDPGLSYKELLSCVKEIKLPAPKPLPNVDAPDPSESTKISDEIGACDPSKRLALWARPALYVGFGESRYSKSGRLTGTTPSVKAFWATYSQGWDRGGDSVRALFLAHASRKLDDRVPDPSDSTAFLRQDSSALIGRLRLGKEKWHAFLDFGREHMSLGNSTTENIRYAGAGAEFKVLDDVWLQLGGVTERGYKDGTSQNKVTTGLRFGSEPFLSLPGSK